MAPATASPLTEGLLAFARRRRSPAPDLSGFGPVPGWPPGALSATCFVWERRVRNEAASVELGQHLLTVAQKTPLASEALEAALQRLIEDEEAHVALASGVLTRLGAKPPAFSPSIPNPATEAPARMLLRYVITGLVVAETVSAARLAAVRRHTDLPVPLACLDLFLRDEIAHADLGVLLLPPVWALVQATLGAAEAEALVAEELRGTFRYLDQVVGLDAERRGLVLEARAQPPDNAGVVEPVIDALAFRAALEDQVFPRLEAQGIDARAFWAHRWTPSNPAATA